MGRHDVQMETQILAPTARVWKVLTDPRGYRKWMLHVHEVRFEGKELRLGSHITLTTRTTNHTLSTTVEVTRLEAPKVLAWKSIEELMDGQPFGHVSDVTTEFKLEPNGKTTRVVVDAGFVAKSLKAKLGAGLLLSTKVKPELQKTLAELKAICE
jgi:uncharacterized protein YndB with AHSA1/START domain